MEQNQIVVRQIPVIEHDLATVGRSVTERINALNLEAQVVTEETVQTLKKTKAELAKEAKDWEEQRKAVKKAVNSPYDEFEAVYKAEIIDKYKSADETLKSNINDFEMKIKAEKKANVMTYFVELCQVEKIDWLHFDRLGIEILLSETETAYKKKVADFIGKVVDDIKLINSEQFAAEMLVEYKRTLNASQAITAVRERKEAEKLEAERIRANRTINRKSKLTALGFIFHDLTRTLNWVQDETILVKFDDVENVSDDRWNEIYVSLENQVNEKKLPTIGELQKKQVLSAPVVEEQKKPEAIELDVTFKVYGTFEQLTALNNYLKENGFKYKQIN